MIYRISMAERFDPGLYVDEHAAEIRRCEEQLKLAIMKREEGRAHRAARKGEERRRLRENVRKWELAEQN